MKLESFMTEFSPSKGSVKIDTTGVIAKYKKVYDDMLAKKASFRYAIYCITPGNRYMVHVKVPSEKVPEMHYDVVLEFIPQDNPTMSYRQCHVRMFSNSPSGLAYIHSHWDPDSGKMLRFNSNNTLGTVLGSRLPSNRLLIPGLESRLGKLAIGKAPITRNPLGLPIPDKSIYLAIFHIERNVPFDMVVPNNNNTPIHQLRDSIPTIDAVLKERKRLENDAKKAQAAEVTKANALFKTKERRFQKTGGIRGVQQMKSMESTRKTSPIKTTNAMRSTRSANSTSGKK